MKIVHISVPYQKHIFFVVFFITYPTSSITIFQILFRHRTVWSRLPISLWSYNFNTSLSYYINMVRGTTYVYIIISSYRWFSYDTGRSVITVSNNGEIMCIRTDLHLVRIPISIILLYTNKGIPIIYYIKLSHDGGEVHLTRCALYIYIIIYNVSR